MKKFLAVFLVFCIIPLVYAAGGGGGGGYGGSGGGGGSGNTLEFTESKNIIDKILQTGDYYTLKLKDRSTHNFFIRSQDPSQVVLVIAEPLQELTFPIGGSTEIDLNQDGTTDILFQAKAAITQKTTQVEIKDSFERKSKEESQNKQQPTQQPSGLLCGDKPSRRERVQCRLDLEKEEFEYEYKLRFLPEECIPLEGKQRARCISIYQSVQQCWKFPDTPARVNCVKNQIRFKNVREEIQSCIMLPAEERKPCIENVKDNVYTIIKFKFYNLEEKAEGLLEEGNVPQDAVAQFITEVEGKKVEFNLAATIAEKRQIITAVNKLWKEFLSSTLQP